VNCGEGRHVVGWGAVGRCRIGSGGPWWGQAQMVTHSAFSTETPTEPAQ
jgi:hypothetical protein